MSNIGSNGPQRKSNHRLSGYGLLPSSWEVGPSKESALAHDLFEVTDQIEQAIDAGAGDCLLTPVRYPDGTESVDVALTIHFETDAITQWDAASIGKAIADAVRDVAAHVEERCGVEQPKASDGRYFRVIEELPDGSQRICLPAADELTASVWVRERNGRHRRLGHPQTCKMIELDQRSFRPLVKAKSARRNRKGGAA